MKVAIVGAGVAGLSCANRLRTFGLAPIVFDKGRGPAGRMASRRIATPIGEAVFDMGAQYFTVRTSQFADQVAEWVAAGLAAPWPEAGPDAWVGTPSMSSPLTAMANGHDIRWSTFAAGLKRDRDGWRLHLEDREEGPFDVVAIALPAEQATSMLATSERSFMRQSVHSVSMPCWTGLFAFDAPLRTRGAIMRNEGALAWASRNAGKPGRTGPEAWVVHARPGWSQEHLEAEPDEVARLLLTELLDLAGEGGRTPVALHAHRWRYARPCGLGLGRLWNPLTGVGVCGDWLSAPRVESAWLSGLGLAETIVRQPPPTAGLYGVASRWPTNQRPTPVKRPSND